MSTKQKRATQPQPPPLNLDPISEYRAWQALTIYFTILLNRQLHRRWHLEQKAMHDLPVSQRFRPVTLLEPVPTLHNPPPCIITTTTTANKTSTKTLSALRARVQLLRARVEKGKELASEIERRMANPRITFPTHFCHTCVVDGESGGVEVLLTKCGHRVCRTCLAFGVGGDGVYECSICFAPAQFVEKGRARSPVTVGDAGGDGDDGVQQRCQGREGQIPGSVSRRLVSGSSGRVKDGGKRMAMAMAMGMGRKASVTPLVCQK